MKKILILSQLLWTHSAFARECATLFENENFGGATWKIDAESALNNFSRAMIERRSWHGYLGGWRGSDRSWNDAVSSLTVAQGCILSIWTAADFTESKRIFDSGSKILNAPDNDSYSSFQCTCNDTQIRGPLGTAIFAQPINIDFN